MKSALHWKNAELALEMPEHKCVYSTWIIPFTRHIVVLQLGNYRELCDMKEYCSHSGNPFSSLGLQVSLLCISKCCVLGDF